MTSVRGDKVKTRIVSSNTWVNGESASWKLDYYKFKGLTFAEVLENTIKHSALKTESGLNQSVTTSNPYRDTNTALSNTNIVTRYTKSRRKVQKSILIQTLQGRQLMTPLAILNKTYVQGSNCRDKAKMRPLWILISKVLANITSHCI